MKQKLRTILRKACLAIPLMIGCNANAADYYWVGEAGSWSDLSHWANTSGGTGNAYTIQPGSADNVYFDANSFSLPLQTVQLDVNGICKNMDWTGATGVPVFANVNNTNLTFHGSLNLIQNLRWLYNGPTTNFLGNGTNEIDMAGKTLPGIAMMTTNGEYQLTGNFSFNTFRLLSGKLITNGYDLRVSQELSFGSNNSTRILDLTNSTIYMRLNSFADFLPTNGTLDVISNNTNLFSEGDNNISNAPSLNELRVKNNATCTLPTATDMTTLQIDAGGTIVLENGAEYNVGTLITNGTSINSVTLEKSNSLSANEPIISLTNAFCGDYIDVLGISSSGALAETGANYNSSGTNSGWSFGTCVPTVADFTSSNQSICQGYGTSFKNISYGGIPSSILWDFGDGNTSSSTDPVVWHTYTTPGIYTITLFAGNSSASATINVQEIQTVDAGPDQMICSTSDVILDGSMGGSAIVATWQTSDGTFSNSGALNTVYTPSIAEITAGEVTLTLKTITSVCPSVNDQVTITIDVCSGLNDDLTTNVFAVYPTETSGIVNVELHNETAPINYLVFDLIGNQVSQGEADHSTIDLSHLASGKYILQLSTDQHLEKQSIHINK